MQVDEWFRYIQGSEEKIEITENPWRNFRNGLRKVGYVLSADTSLV
jgi:hypothetical protein